MKTRRFIYTKANGDVTNRYVVLVSEPRENYLVYDMSDLSEDQINYFTDALRKSEEFRDEALTEFEDVTGIKIDSLWRSFKPGGIEWEQEDEV